MPEIPDPLVMLGTKVPITTVAQWHKQKALIRAEFEKWVYGKMPPRPDNLRAVVTGTRRQGDVEVRDVRLEFDPQQISYRELLEIFFVIHDPTTLNRQGNDSGTQYRSVIFYHSDEQRTVAEDVMREAQTHWRKPIVTPAPRSNPPAPLAKTWRGRRSASKAPSAGWATSAVLRRARDGCGRRSRLSSVTRVG